MLLAAVIAQMKSDGTLHHLHEKYGLVYAYPFGEICREDETITIE